MGYAQDKRAQEQSSATTVAIGKPDLPADVSVNGVVVDPDGNPVGGATVRALTAREHEPVAESDAQGRFELHVNRDDAGALGAFRFEHVPAKPLHDQWLKEIPWDVVVVAKPYTIAWRHLDAAQPSKPLTIALTPEAQIRGQVIDRQKRPIQSAEVRVESIEPPGTDPLRGPCADPGMLDLQRSRLAPVAKTDADGKVTIDGLPPDVRLGVLVKHDDFRRDFLYVATTHQPQPDIEVPEYADGKETTERKKVYAADFSAVLGPPRRDWWGGLRPPTRKNPSPTHGSKHSGNPMRSIP